MISATLNKIDYIGKVALQRVQYTLDLFFTFYLAFREALTDRRQSLRSLFSVVSAQIYFTGWQALPLISVLGMAAGGIVVLQTFSHFAYLGGAQGIGNLLVLVIFREVGPFLTALVVIARSGTAVASELGNLRANREIDAFETMGINPLSYIVFPRILGGVISLVCLSFYFVLVAMVGGFFLTKWIQGISLHFYLDSIVMSVTTADILLFLTKNICGGLIIFSVACYHGLSVRRSPTEVPAATTRAVVNCIVYVVIFNLSLTAIFYINQLIKLGMI